MTKKQLIELAEEYSSMIEKRKNNFPEDYLGFFEYMRKQLRMNGFEALANNPYKTRFPIDLHKRK